MQEKWESHWNCDIYKDVSNEEILIFNKCLRFAALKWMGTVSIADMICELTMTVRLVLNNVWDFM